MKCLLLILAIGGCAASGPEIRVLRQGASAPMQVATFRVDGDDVYGPTAQLTRYADGIRGLIGSRAVTVTVQGGYASGLFGGRPVGLHIRRELACVAGQPDTGCDAVPEVRLYGYAAGQHVDLRISPERLRGHAGAGEYDLESDDGVHYRGRGRGSATSPGSVDVRIPRALEEAWGEDAPLLVALLLSAV